MTDASTPLSSHYTLGDLTVTTQPLSSPNLPSSQDEMNNLTYLADLLEQIGYKVGGFRVPSAYRTRELQERLAVIGEPVSPNKSFHEVGRGADIVPTNGMQLAEFFGRMVADPELLRRFSEISIKPSQGAIHLAVNVPGDERDPKVLRLDDSGTYARMTDEELAEYIKPFVASEEVEELASNINNPGINPVYLAVGAAAIALLFLAGGRRTA